MKLFVEIENPITALNRGLNFIFLYFLFFFFFATHLIINKNFISNKTSNVIPNDPLQLGLDQTSNKKPWDQTF